jgi:pullulanase
VVVFNATSQTRNFNLPDFQDVPLTLHPLQKASADPVVRASSFNRPLGAFSVPGRTAAVFWADRLASSPQDAAQALTTNALLAVAGLNG